jgi:hypothetical protein
MNKIETLIADIKYSLFSDENREPPNDEALKAFVEAKANALALLPDAIPFLAAEIDEVLRRLKYEHTIKMKVGALFQSEKFKPWLESRQNGICPYYWDRYKQHLFTTKGFSKDVVRTLNIETDRILDRLGNPAEQGVWDRRGLVVGHVQSGKTANYTGLICKAADAGYKVIIVLAGMLNSLRNQTQERIDSDFMGWCTHMKDYVGVSRFGTERKPVCLTTVTQDFALLIANSNTMNLKALNEPVVVVIKKNKSTLENLHKWLTEHNKYKLQDFPMLLVDDEADHASINTNKPDKDPTSINIAIRNLLSIFDRSSFVGYTATPFANIFIDPKNEEDMQNGDAYRDLFPRDFILSLDPPTNYIGAQRLFSSVADLDSIREINDNVDLLDIKHKIDFVPVDLPPSLVKAIDSFILAKAIRLLRGQVGKHHSMMINVSRFTAVQNHINNLVYYRVEELRHAINNFSGLPPESALKDRTMASLHQTWESDFSKTEFGWSALQNILKEAIFIKVISVNSGSKDSLDYSKKNYPNGRSVIAVGGLSLSRGLTLEGLLVSYFLRNSIMYDTLMQMGRWFGYRDGYEDLCRIFMTPDAASWYAHIADATEELRSDFEEMEELQLTPLEFGLRVRSHPTALIVTARNKMRTGKAVPHKISLEGRLVETVVLSSNKEVIDQNLALIKRTLDKAESEAGVISSRTSQGYVWEKAPVGIVQDFVEQFKNHPHSFYTYSEPLVEHLSWLKSEGKDKCDILFKTLQPTSDDKIIPEVGLIGRMQERTDTATISEGVISFKKNSRIGEPRDEEIGVAPLVLKALKENSLSKTPNPKLYRQVDGKRPLLIIHMLKVKAAPTGIVAGYGLSFPGSATTRKPQKLVEYIVNIPYWNQAYKETLEEDEDE